MRPSLSHTAATAALEELVPATAPGLRPRRSPRAAPGTGRLLDPDSCAGRQGRARGLRLGLQLGHEQTPLERNTAGEPETHRGKRTLSFYVHSIHLQSWPVLCTTYKYMVEEMHRGYLQEPNNSLYTSKNENI